MTAEIRIVQFFYLTLRDSTSVDYAFQNYFVGQTINFAPFAPFQVQGGVSNLNGDNVQIQVLFPATEYAIKLVEAAGGNRKTRLTLVTNQAFENGTVSNEPLSVENYIGIGAGFSEDTIELRFNTAADSVASNFPARRLNQDNVGFLPLDSALSLR